MRAGLSAGEAQRLYDRIGGRYDWFGRFESRAKETALALLPLAGGVRLLNAGMGTGREQAWIAERLEPPGMAFGIDLSGVMTRLAMQRCQAPACQADTRWLPYANESFDCIYAAYVLDLLAGEDIPAALAEYWRALKEGGALVMVALAEGTTPASRAVVAAWKAAYALSPEVCGGCRPLRLGELAAAAGLHIVSQQVVVQLGVPSEVVAALKRD